MRRAGPFRSVAVLFWDCCWVHPASRPFALGFFWLSPVPASLVPPLPDPQGRFFCQDLSWGVLPAVPTLDPQGRCFCRSASALRVPPWPSTQLACASFPDRSQFRSPFPPLSAGAWADRHLSWGAMPAVPALNAQGRTFCRSAIVLRVRPWPSTRLACASFPDQSQFRSPFSPVSACLPSPRTPPEAPALYFPGRALSPDRDPLSVRSWPVVLPQPAGLADQAQYRAPVPVAG